MPIETRGLDGAIQFVDRFDDNRRMAAVRAINRVATEQRTAAARMIRNQIAFPASYLNPGGGRLVVSKRATRGSLEARITARSRPTSLARFAMGSATPGRQNTATALEVRSGRATFVRRAFLIRLRSGTALTDTRSNLGLAIRLRPGESLANKRQQIRFSEGLYLLYGPSVQQVFLDNQNQGVAADLEVPTANKLVTEYLRLLEL